MKIAIIGGGSAGIWTALHYGYCTRNDNDVEIELIHDPEIDTVPVGQGTTLNIVPLLWQACGTDWYHNEIRATPKLGILYENFSKENPNIYHPFPLNSIALQVDPKYLQRYILNSGLFNVKEENVTDLDTVDADVIFDCRGNIGKEDIEYETLYSPVNSVLLSVGPQTNPQLWSRHVATPDGWTFVIPNTTKTLSYGYVYNKDITPLETAKTNFSEVFPEASESYSGHFDHKEKVVNLPFESYMAKEPLRIDSNGRKIILNGNRLAFLEPMESTAVGFYAAVAQQTFNWVLNKQSRVGNVVMNDNDPHQINGMSSTITRMIHEIHIFISWHYTKGSIYDTPFWRVSQSETTTIFEHPEKQFQNILDLAKSLDYMDCRLPSNQLQSLGVPIEYGQWGLHSFKLWYDNYIK
jgi:hypothetical protein